MPEAVVESKYLIGKDAIAIRLKIERLAKLPDFVCEIRQIVKEEDSDDNGKNKRIVRGVAPFVADFKDLLGFVPAESAQSFRKIVDEISRSSGNINSTPKHKLDLITTLDGLTTFVVGRAEKSVKT